MTQGLRTFLTFQGGAATAALDLYRDVFDDFELIEIDHYGPGDSRTRRHRQGREVPSRR